MVKKNKKISDLESADRMEEKEKLSYLETVKSKLKECSNDEERLQYLREQISHIDEHLEEENRLKKDYDNSIAEQERKDDEQVMLLTDRFVNKGVKHLANTIQTLAFEADLSQLREEARRVKTVIKNLETKRHYLITFQQAIQNIINEKKCNESVKELVEIYLRLMGNFYKYVVSTFEELKQAVIETNDLDKNYPLRIDKLGYPAWVMQVMSARLTVAELETVSILDLIESTNRIAGTDSPLASVNIRTLKQAEKHLEDDFPSRRGLRVIETEGQSMTAEQKLEEVFKEPVKRTGTNLLPLEE